MKNNKLISIILMIFVIFSGLGFVFAAGGGGGGSGDTPNASISVAFDKEAANIGNNVILKVTITNGGPYNLTKVLVKAKLPDGLTYQEHYTGLDRNIYDPSTGIWDVGNMTYGKKGSQKTINIVAKVSSSLAGKTVTADTVYTQIYYNNTLKIVQLTSLPSRVSTSLKVNNTCITTDNNGNTAPTSQNTAKKTAIAKAIKNTTSKNGIDTLQNLNPPTQGNAYEVNNITAPTPPNTLQTVYAILGGLAIAIMIGIGYFKGILG